ncbi:MAG: flavin reductase family protein [Gammaproteobacteria bacterium]|nr:flavin reductase family protein [Gammaproteobacteria bacterium]
MAKKSLPLSQVYRLIEPGPVVMVTTAVGGQPNIMTLSWHMMLDFEPPILACVISNRDYTFGILKKTKECVINIPTAELAQKVVSCGNSSGRTVDKFRKFGLTPSPAKHVGAPLIEECYANLECRVVDASLVNRYNIFIVETVKAWIDRSQKNPRTIHHRGRGVFAVDGEIIKLPSRMK